MPASRTAALGLCAVLALGPSAPAAQRVPGIVIPFNPEQNAILNPDRLALFYEKIGDLGSTRRGQVVIFHIGDSHVEAGYFTGIVREGLQQLFGDAGRGVVKPVILGVSPKKRIGSVEMRQDVKALRLWVGIKESETSAGFNALVLYHEKGDTYWNYEILDKDGRLLAQVTSTRPKNWPGAEGVQASRVELPGLFREVILRTAKDPKSPNQRYAQLYGVSLENSASGVVYHSYGINGANCESFCNLPFFNKQLEHVQPDLVIISLGTNDGSTPYFRKEDFEAKLDALVLKVREICPHSAILLTTAPDSYFPRQRRLAAKPNTNMGAERDAVVEIGLKRECAVWDLYAIMGGAGSMNFWRDSALANLDNIHFTKEGYEQQGRLLLEALMKGIGAHAASRSR